MLEAANGHSTIPPLRPNCRRGQWPVEWVKGCHLATKLIHQRGKLAGVWRAGGRSPLKKFDELYCGKYTGT